MFSELDIEQILQKGKTLDQVEHQIQQFKIGFPFIELHAPATIGNGIKQLNEADITRYADMYDRSLPENNILKFVPASGAASRMFGHLFAYRDAFTFSEQSMAEFNAEEKFSSVPFLMKNLPKIAFFDELKQIMKEHGYSLENCLKNYDINLIIDYLLTDKGLNYAALPKALLLFHSYENGVRTALEEHLVESANYSCDMDNRVQIHFTLSPEHIVLFEKLLQRVLPAYQAQFGVTFDISHSMQMPVTDTVAVNPDNSLFRNTDGSLLFRPGGHGALIYNLNELQADIVFIKNIDNIVPDRLKPTTYLFKKAMAGYLFALRKQVFEYLYMLEKGELNEITLQEIIDFIEKELWHKFHKAIHVLEFNEKVKQLFQYLNRPIRICGMVKNEGEPGGGPFIVKDSTGQLSLQIIESSQINFTDEHQKQIALSATHFNPVDLVCSVKNYKGEKFNLLNFVDEKTGFISEKSKDGKPLKAMELPGLWNGAMANWITVFMEVPIITFNPVKTVNDLLRNEHLN